MKTYILPVFAALLLGLTAAPASATHINWQNPDYPQYYGSYNNGYNNGYYGNGYDNGWHGSRYGYGYRSGCVMRTRTVIRHGRAVRRSVCVR